MRDLEEYARTEKARRGAPSATPHEPVRFSVVTGD
jgi:hypothetical protein